MGFPSEVYFRGTMILWFIPMYFVSFPIVAYFFLPTIYELKLTSLYEYLELRFTFANRVIASIIFVIQTLLYMAVALYAPSLTLSSSLPIPLTVSIVFTASLSAIYLFLGGARAGIYTSALQMLLILGSLFVIICASLITWTPYEVIEKNAEGGRLIFFEVVLMNIPMNTVVLIMYVTVGLIIFAAFFECHPELTTKDQIFPTFVKDMLYVIPGLEGLFLAAIYAAGLSTLTASYSALTAVTIEDVVKITFNHLSKDSRRIADDVTYKLVKILPFGFAFFAVLLAIAIRYLDTMILQIAFSIFGAAGGASLGIFVVGLFCPWISSIRAAIVGQVSAILGTLSIVCGSLYFQVRAVDLPLNRSCEDYYSDSNNSSPFNFSAPLAGTVVASGDANIASWISQISYQYYGVVGVVVCLVVSHIVQAFDYIIGAKNTKPVNKKLVASWVRSFASSVTVTGNPVDIPLLSESENNSGKESCHIEKDI
ncbi:hypothetical protein FO519_003617 [Halicephalobus sp. NKZ332]|nr:hypothetical protein FO519_003617 [Halicephalobus sp. NKZ332]